MTIFNRPRLTKLILATLILSVLSSCKSASIGYGGVAEDQAAVVYNLLPPFLGGGLSDKILKPGEMRPLFPWERLYPVTTVIREISWDNGKRLKTRTRDGNSLNLIISVRYKVMAEPSTLKVLVQTCSLTDEGINEFVATTTRSNIRFFMNKLNTEDFLKRAEVEKVQQEIEQAVSKSLAPYGIMIELIKLRDFVFDQKYQDLLDQIQASQEKREEAEQKKATLIAKKDMEMKQVQGQIEKLITMAQGELTMANIRGLEYLEQKKNEALRIEAEGNAEVAAMKARLDAFSGAGGESLLKIEIVKGLIAGKPEFVVLNNGSSSGGTSVEGTGSQSLNVQRTDTNTLLEQLGLIEATTAKNDTK
jgi:hypothetical protein